MKCIYLRTNLVNGKQYVGQANDFKQREYDWKCLKNHYAGKLIYNARKKYGLENFKTEVLRECKTKDELNEWEKYYIKTLNTKVPNGYNLTDGGEGTLGVIVSDETRKKMSDVKKGRHVSEETKKKISEAKKGKYVGESSPMYGRKRPEFAEKMKGENNPFFGKTHTQDTIDKIIKANKGKTPYNKGKTLEELFGKEKADFLKKKAINNAYKVIQCDLNENVIKIWENAKEASKILNLEYTNINKCIKGKYKTAHGFIWKRAT